MSSRRFRGPLALTALPVVAMVLAGCGSEGGDTATPATAPPPPIEFPSTLPVPTSLTAGEARRASPRWEQLTVLTGNGAMETPQVTVAENAIQWRVRYTCQTGQIRIVATPAARAGALVERPCPDQGEGYSRQTGPVKLSVQAAGQWQATIEQQVDTPLNEPPLAEMANGRVLKRGEFKRIDKAGSGSVVLYELADGRRALRFEDGFDVLNDPDLVVWVSSVADPKTTAEFVNDHVEIAALKSTKGSQNYIVPDNIPTDQIRSIALFCVPVPSVYIAAALS